MIMEMRFGDLPVGVECPSWASTLPSHLPVRAYKSLKQYLNLAIQHSLSVKKLTE
jgi:hypothetical protein